MSDITPSSSRRPNSGNKSSTAIDLTQDTREVVQHQKPTKEVFDPARQASKQEVRPNTAERNFETYSEQILAGAKEFVKLARQRYEEENPPSSSERFAPPDDMAPPHYSDLNKVLDEMGRITREGDFNKNRNAILRDIISIQKDPAKFDCFVRVLEARYKRDKSLRLIKDLVDIQQSKR